MHLNGSWQDASTGSASISVVLYDHPMHSGHDSSLEPRTIELRKRFSVSAPEATDEGLPFEVGSVPRTVIIGGAEHFWLRTAPLANQIDVVVVGIALAPRDFRLLAAPRAARVAAVAPDHCGVRPLARSSAFT